jgi:hypothetical protein
LPSKKSVQEAFLSEWKTHRTATFSRDGIDWPGWRASK